MPIVGPRLVAALLPALACAMAGCTADDAAPWPGDSAPIDAVSERRSVTPSFDAEGVTFNDAADGAPLLAFSLESS